MLSMKAIPKYIIAAYLCCYIFAAYIHFSGNAEILLASNDNSYIADRNTTFYSEMCLLAVPGLLFFLSKKFFLPALNRFRKNPIQNIKAAFSFNRFQMLILIAAVLFAGLSVSNNHLQMEGFRAEGAPSDFIENCYRECGYFIFFSLAPFALCFYAAEFIGKKKVKLQLMETSKCTTK